MKSITLIIVVTMFCSQSFSQNKTIIGEIIDASSTKNLAYVNIGIANKKVGTVSNNKGVFVLKLNDSIKKTDTIVFSHIGYVSLKRTVAEIEQSKTAIPLIPKTTNLNEVVLNLKTPKAKKIGKSGTGIGMFHWNFYSAHEKDVDDRLSKELGMKFNINKECKINALNFNISSNQFKSLKFRLNIYSINNGKPNELLLNQNIIFEIKDEFLGWFKVDLKPYDIYFEEDIGEIAVTIQWIESVKTNEKSKYLSLSAAATSTRTMFYREKVFDKWNKKKGNLSFYLDASCK